MIADPRQVAQTDRQRESLRGLAGHALWLLAVLTLVVQLVVVRAQVLDLRKHLDHTLDAVDREQTLQRRLLLEWESRSSAVAVDALAKQRGLVEVERIAVQPRAAVNAEEAP